MKKNYTIIIAAIAILAFSACAKSDGTADNTSAVKQAEVYEMKEGDTQINGEVVSIVGNEVTLALGEVTEREKPSEDAPENDGSSDSDNSSSAERPTRGDRVGSADGEMPDPGSFERNGNSDSKSVNKRGGAAAALEKNGEIGTYIIPVGMTVGGVSGRSSDYSGISEGDILTLIIDSEGTVKSAEVR